MRRSFSLLVALALSGCAVIGDDIVDDALCPWAQANQAFEGARLTPDCPDGQKALLWAEDQHLRYMLFMDAIDAECRVEAP